MDVIKEFNRLYHGAGERTWLSATWLGVPIRKAPTDLFIYQQLIHRLRPDVIVETGTYKGGSALFMAHVLDALGHGKVVTIDTMDHSDRPQHPRIDYLIGSSLDPGVEQEVKRRVSGSSSVIVVLDSDHMEEHVFRECVAYCDLVTPGSYLIVEDTNILNQDCQAVVAVERFLKTRSDFEADRDCERLMLTFNPGGYLRRVR